jgi:hypothetical protein
MCAQYLHRIHPPSPFSHLLPLPLVLTPNHKAGPLLPSCSLILKNKQKNDIFVCLKHNYLFNFLKFWIFSSEKFLTWQPQWWVPGRSFSRHGNVPGRCSRVFIGELSLRPPRRCFCSPLIFSEQAGVCCCLLTCRLCPLSNYYSASLQRASLNQPFEWKAVFYTDILISRTRCYIKSLWDSTDLQNQISNLL